MDLGPTSPKQWICRWWVGKLDSNELDEHNNRFRWQEGVNRQGYDEENRPWQGSRRIVLIYCS